MAGEALFRRLALALPDAVEAPHFETTSFRVKGKIFATLGEKEGRAVIKLTPEQQEMLIDAEPGIFERIPNAWGGKGWTWMSLKAADRMTVESALKSAWNNVAAKPAARRPKGKR